MTHRAEDQNYLDAGFIRHLLHRATSMLHAVQFNDDLTDDDLNLCLISIEEIIGQAIYETTLHPPVVAGQSDSAEKSDDQQVVH